MALASIYQRWIVDTGKQPELFLLLSFLVTFGFIRTSAHMIRAQVSWWPGNVTVGGTHIHHLVWGIITILITGYLAIAIAPGSPGREILAVLFGVGTGLTLDEFALWVDLKDVYWTQEGRRSIDAVIIAASVGGVVLVGLRAWLDVADEAASIARIGVGVLVSLHLVFALVNVLKGKYWTASGAVFMTPIGIFGAVRPAKPDSVWARLFPHARTLRKPAG